MKILQLISGLGFFGAESVVLELSRELHAVNVRNVIGVFENFHNPHTELVQYGRKNNLETTVFECNGKIDLRTLNAIKQFVGRNGIDIIHTHGYKSNTYGLIIARLTKRRIVSTCHNWIASDLRTRTYYVLDKYVLSKFDRVIAVSEDIKNELLRRGFTEDRIRLIHNGVDVNKYDVATETVRNELDIDKGSGTKCI